MKTLKNNKIIDNITISNTPPVLYKRIKIKRETEAQRIKREGRY